MSGLAMSWSFSINRPVACDRFRRWDRAPVRLRCGQEETSGQRLLRLANGLKQQKIQGLNPQAYLADILTKLVNGWPMRKIDELLPWAWSDPSKEASGKQQPR